MTEPPRIETARLVMRAHTPDDFGDLAEMWADAPVVRHITGRPATRQESWMRLLRYRGLWPLLGYGYWALHEAHSGRFVGDLGFADFRRVLQPSIDGVPEAGWVLAAWAHGKGYAREALGAAVAWLDTQPCGERSVCLVDAANHTSLRLAGLHGYGAPTAVEFQGEPSLLLTRPRWAPPAGTPHST